MNWRSVIAVVLAGAMLPGVGSVTASTGVSIDVSRIYVSEELAPGGQYDLPRFGVRNPGTEPTNYTIVVSYVDGQDAHQPPTGWFSFSPATMTLEGGQSRPVTTSLEVPPDAEAGTYQALIGPQMATEGSGPQIGAGAAARLEFTVAECDGLECWLRWLFRWIGEHLYVLLVPLAISAFIGLRVVRRRFAFSVQRRPA